MRTWWRYWDKLVNGVEHEAEPRDEPAERFKGDRLALHDQTSNV
jgi:hypothetical protein